MEGIIFALHCIFEDTASASYNKTRPAPVQHILMAVWVSKFSVAFLHTESCVHELVNTTPVFPVCFFPNEQMNPALKHDPGNVPDYTSYSWKWLFLSLRCSSLGAFTWGQNVLYSNSLLITNSTHSEIDHWGFSDLSALLATNDHPALISKSTYIPCITSGRVASLWAMTVYCTLLNRRRENKSIPKWRKLQ